MWRNGATLRQARAAPCGRSSERRARHAACWGLLAAGEARAPSRWTDTAYPGRAGASATVARASRTTQCSQQLLRTQCTEPAHSSRSSHAFGAQSPTRRSRRLGTRCAEPTRSPPHSAPRVGHLCCPVCSCSVIGPGRGGHAGLGGHADHGHALAIRPPVIWLLARCAVLRASAVHTPYIRARRARRVGSV